MIVNRLLRLIRPNRMSHTAPAPLAALDSLRCAPANEHQEDETLAKARHTLLSGGDLRIQPAPEPRPSRQLLLPVWPMRYMATGIIGGGLTVLAFLHFGHAALFLFLAASVFLWLPFTLLRVIVAIAALRPDARERFGELLEDFRAIFRGPGSNGPARSPE